MFCSLLLRSLWRGGRSFLAQVRNTKTNQVMIVAESRLPFMPGQPKKKGGDGAATPPSAPLRHWFHPHTHTATPSD